MTTEQQAKLISQQIWQELTANFPQSEAKRGQKTENLAVPIGVSNRHIHLSREDMDILFGQGSSLTRFKAVKQPGQFAAEQTVTIKGRKGEIKNVRVLGPLRKETQVEVSVADNYVLGIKAPICMSGELDRAEPLEIIGPQGRVMKEHCAIVAWRHIHIPPQLAQQYGLQDGQKVDVQVSGERAGIMQNVIIRASEASVLEMHIDIEEANAYGLKNDSVVTII